MVLYVKCRALYVDSKAKFSEPKKKKGESLTLKYYMYSHAYGIKKGVWNIHITRIIPDIGWIRSGFVKDVYNISQISNVLCLC